MEVSKQIFFSANSLFLQKYFTLFLLSLLSFIITLLLLLLVHYAVLLIIQSSVYIISHYIHCICQHKDDAQRNYFWLVLFINIYTQENVWNRDIIFIFNLDKSSEWKNQTFFYILTNISGIYKESFDFFIVDHSKVISVHWQTHQMYLQWTF